MTTTRRTRATGRSGDRRGGGHRLAPAGGEPLAGQADLLAGLTAGRDGQGCIEGILLKSAAFNTSVVGVEYLDLVAGGSLEDRAVGDPCKNPHGVDQAVAERHALLAHRYRTLRDALDEAWLNKAERRLPKDAG